MRFAIIKYTSDLKLWLYKEPWTLKCICLSLILGTGTNACYVEKTEEVETFDGPNSKPYVVVNTEWGAFGDDGCLDFLRTLYDVQIDKHSINPGKQLYVF